MQIQFPDPVIPDHVPASLVRPFPYVFGMTTREDPFADWATAVHEGPGIFYAAHAYPRTVHFVDAMPKTPSGKIQRIVLKQRRIEELAGAG